MSDEDGANVAGCVVFDGAVVVADAVVAIVADASFAGDDVVAVDAVRHFVSAVGAVMENVVDAAHDDVDFVVYDYAYVVAAVGQLVAAAVDDAAADTDL